MSEAVEIILSAEDKATAVMQQAAAKADNLSTSLSGIGKQSAVGSDAVQKLANVLGQGWITQVAADVKELSESLAGASKSMQEGGAASLTLKAGIAGVVIAAGVSVGKNILEWAYSTKQFREELDQAKESAARLTSNLVEAHDKIFNFERRKIEITSESDIERQERTRTLIDQISKEAEGLNKTVETQRRRVQEAGESWWTLLENVHSGYGAIREQEANQLKENEKLLEMRKRQKAELEASIDPNEKALQLEKERREAAEAARERLVREAQAEQDAVNQTAQALQDQIAQMSMGAEEYELMKAKALTLNELEQERLATLIKQKHEMMRQQKEQEQAEKDLQKKLEAEAKAKEKEVTDLQKEIEDLKSEKIDTSMGGTGLATKDERFLSRGTNANSERLQQMELAKKQVEIAEKQRQLNELIEKHLRSMSQSTSQQGVLELVVGA